MNPQKITEQAKKIMDNFIKALDKAPKTDSKFEVKREQNIREESSILQTNANFSELMMKNAPKVKDGCILAEKKKW